jgi:uncharacterized membrane protein YcaP (DUF421 family)
MWSSLMHPSISILELLIRVLAVYFFILVLLRISGKRQLGQLSAIEFVSILLISNAVQNSMNGGDNSLLGGLVLSGTLVLLSSVIAVLSYRYTGIRHLVEGVPTIVIRKGKIVKPSLAREKVTSEELMTLLRRQGVHQVNDVELGILESDGMLSISKYDSPRSADINDDRNGTTDPAPGDCD